MEKNSIRITLRIPEQLHGKLTDLADAGARSLNSEILKRLEASLVDDEPRRNESPYVTVDEMQAMMKESFKTMYDNLLQAGLKPVMPYPDLDNVFTEELAKAGK